MPGNQDKESSKAVVLFMAMAFDSGNASQCLSRAEPGAKSKHALQV